jgi:glycosyltransferase involved in cell wall biosynthesis
MLMTMRDPQVDIVVPVRNEERDLAASVRRLVSYVREGFPFTARVTIADNGSTDDTWAIADRLAREFDEVRVVRMEQPGRGRALRAVWSQSDAEVLAYMDVDLSTDLNALSPLVAPLLSGHSDVAIGTRLARGSRVIRGPKRELISRCYNLLLHACMGTRFSDAQCGFKAIRREQALTLLPLTEDNGWFFDTELLVLAERAGLRIHEVPVDWIDDLDSRVDVVATAFADLRGMVRLGSGFARGTIKVPQLREPSLGGTRARGELVLQIVRFAMVGIASTIAYVLLYLMLRGVMSAQAANVLSLLLTAVANTAANRRLTFGISGRLHAARHQVKGLIAFGIGLALTSGALAVLHTANRGVEVSVLIAANLVATVIRFVLFRTWVFGKSTSYRREPIERDHLRGEAFSPHPAAAHAEPGPAPAARA